MGMDKTNNEVVVDCQALVGNVLRVEENQYGETLVHYLDTDGSPYVIRISSTYSGELIYTKMLPTHAVYHVNDEGGRGQVAAEIFSFQLPVFIKAYRPGISDSEVDKWNEEIVHFGKDLLSDRGNLIVGEIK
jgi:hypothetical protein